MTGKFALEGSHSSELKAESKTAANILLRIEICWVGERRVQCIYSGLHHEEKQHSCSFTDG